MSRTTGISRKAVPPHTPTERRGFCCIIVASWRPSLLTWNNVLSEEKWITSLEIRGNQVTIASVHILSEIWFVSFSGVQLSRKAYGWGAEMGEKVRIFICNSLLLAVDLPGTSKVAIRLCNTHWRSVCSPAFHTIEQDAPKLHLSVVVGLCFSFIWSW